MKWIMVNLNDLQRLLLDSLRNRLLCHYPINEDNPSAGDSSCMMGRA